MQRFDATLLKYQQQGEKTGWTYILVPAEIAEAINPGVRKSYRVKGMLDKHAFSGVSVLPAGEGDFIFAVNAGMRKAIGKQAGAAVAVTLTLDNTSYQLCKELTDCLAEYSEAQQYFNTLPKSHQNYFSKWIEAAKTIQTKEKRIAEAVNALAMQQNFNEMMRAAKQDRQFKRQV